MNDIGALTPEDGRHITKISNSNGKDWVKGFLLNCTKTAIKSCSTSRFEPSGINVHLALDPVDLFSTFSKNVEGNYKINAI